jgi:hypothetical protein
MPTGPGETRALPLRQPEGSAAWFLDDGHAVLVASEPGRKRRGYVVELPGGALHSVTPEGIEPVPRSLVNGRLLGLASDGALALYPVSGGEAEPLKVGLPAGVVPLRTIGDGHFLLVRRSGMPCHVERLDLTTGQLSPWRVLLPEDAVGVDEIYDPVFSADGEVYAYSYIRKVVDLYLFDGLR